jgi:hypothetical protein
MAKMMMVLLIQKIWILGREYFKAKAVAIRR